MNTSCIIIVIKEGSTFWIEKKNADELINFGTSEFSKENIPNKWPKLQLTLYDNNQSTWQNMQSSLKLNCVYPIDCAAGTKAFSVYLRHYFHGKWK